MLRYACDIETNGLLHELDRVHSLVLRDLDTNEVISCSNEGNYLPVQFGLSLLEQADLIVGHNFINFFINCKPINEHNIVIPKVIFR